MHIKNTIYKGDFTAEMMMGPYNYKERTIEVTVGQIIVNRQEAAVFYDS